MPETNDQTAWDLPAREMFPSMEPAEQREMYPSMTPAAQPEAANSQGETEAAPAVTETDAAQGAGAPEKYEFEAPEGHEYDPKVLQSFEEAAREANLTQDAAQALLSKVAPAMVARHQEQVQAIQAEWRQASTTDKEFGGEKLAENLGIAKKAITQFAPELLPMLEQTGLGNHPDVIRAWFRVGKAISEDAFVGGKAPTRRDSLESTFFPTMNRRT